MTPPINIDGSTVDAITIDGTEVTEVTADGEVVSHSTTYSTDDPFALVLVVKADETASDNAYFDGETQNQFRIQDSILDGGVYQLGRGGSFCTVGTPDTNLHLMTVEGTNNGDMTLTLDGSSFSTCNLSDNELTGLTIAALGDGDNELDVQYGQIELLNNYTSSELSSVQSRLKDKWGTP